MPMNDKMRRFVAEYVVDCNAVQAAIRAGYSPKGARTIGSRLLTRPDVAAAIAVRQERKAEQLDLQADRVLRELAAVAFSDVGDVLDFGGETLRLREPSSIPETARRAISSVKVKRYLEGTGEQVRDVELVEFKFWPKDSALDKLARHLGLFKDRVEVTGPDGTPLVTVQAIQALVQRVEGGGS